MDASRQQPRSSTASRATHLELVVGQMASGGGCVGRTADGQVVFVRHAVPGERVVAAITEETRTYLRADAVEILEASPERVEPPCAAAGPGRCGGCDFQHIELGAQRRLKATLVAGHLRHLARIEWPVEVEAVPGSDDGLGWRTRIRFAVDASGRTGLRRHRSHAIWAIDHCPIASPSVEQIGVERHRWPGATTVEVFAPHVTARTNPQGDLASDAVDERKEAPGLVVVTGGRREADIRLPSLGTRRTGLAIGDRVVQEPKRLQVEALGHRYRVSAGAFWQVHDGAAELLSRVVLEGLAPHSGEHVADLYAGVGLYTLPLATAVGPEGRVLSVERDRTASADARHNARYLPQVHVHCESVSPALLAGLDRLDLVVLDPPREGAGTEVMKALVALSPRRIAYVACDPASFARDLRIAIDAGWRLDGLRAFDQFPMTEHVELVGFLEHHSPGASSFEDEPSGSTTEKN